MKKVELYSIIANQIILDKKPSIFDLNHIERKLYSISSDYVVDTCRENILNTLLTWKKYYGINRNGDIILTAYGQNNKEKMYHFACGYLDDSTNKNIKSAVRLALSEKPVIKRKK